MGLGWSTHRNDGWRGQFNRVLRWHERLIASAANGTPDLEDFAFAFFQNCYHLREWIAQTSTVPAADLDALFASSKELRLCRDICNGTKHLNISRPSIDGQFSIAREYAPDEPHGTRLFVVAGGDFYYLIDLAATCVAQWRSFCTHPALRT